MSDGGPTLLGHLAPAGLEAPAEEKRERKDSSASYGQLAPCSLDDFVPEEPVVADLDADVLDPNVRNTTLMDLLFCRPYTAEVTSTITEFGRDHGPARYVRPKEQAYASDGCKCNADEMTRVQVQRDGMQAREAGISYIMGEDDLEFGSASVLRLSSEFHIDSTVTGVGCGWQVGPASAVVEKLRRRVLCVARADDKELERRQQCKDLGNLCMIVLHARGEAKQTTLLCDEARACHEQSWCMEEWGGLSLEGCDVREEKCNSSEEARQIARRWIDGDPSKMAEWRADARRIWLKRGGGHPACCQTNRWSAYVSGIAFCCLPPSWEPLRPWAQQSMEDLCVSMDLFVYEAKRYAWVGARLDQGPTWRFRLDLKDTLDHDDRIPVRTIGQLVSDINQELLEASHQPVLKASAVRLSRVLEDFTELWTSRRWAMHLGSLLVFLHWGSIILQNPLIVGLVFPITSDNEALMKKHFLTAFSISTFILVWLEVRIALCCEVGRKLYAHEHLSFLKLVILSILEKYDIYGDLNFIQVAKLEKPDGWVWRAALVVFLVGVVIMQTLPSCLLLLRCRFNWFAQLGIPYDLSLLCRSSGLHVLMQSINPVHAKVASAVAAQQSDNVHEVGQCDHDCSQGVVDRDLELGIPMLVRGDARKLGMRTKTINEVSDCCADLDVPSEDFCDLPPLPQGLVKEELLKVVETARVKVHVGFVRLLFEDFLQGLLQLSFLAYHWSLLAWFQIAQVIVSVCVSIAISFLGPVLEHRKFREATKQLDMYAAWVAAGGESVSALRSILEAEGAREGKTQEGRVERLEFERPIRCLVAESSEPESCVGALGQWLDSCKRCVTGEPELQQGGAEVFKNGTVAGPGQVIKGRVTCTPQSKFPAAKTQYACGLADEAGIASQAKPLFEGISGCSPVAKVVDFRFTAPQQAGTYPVGWHEDKQRSMLDAVANFSTVSHDRILGYITVRA